MIRAFVIALAITVAGAVWMSGPGHAQSKADKASAEKFFRAGERAYKAGQYLVAAQAFEEALKLYPVPAIVFSTAQAYRLQYFVDKDPGWLKRAIELYRKYISEVSQGGRRDDATASLAELEPILLRLEAEQVGPITTKQFVPATQILVNAQVGGATAIIDGQRGEVPLVRKVDPGQHKVRVEAPGYYPVEQTVTAVEGRLLPVEIDLKPMSATVSLDTNGTQISIDGRPYTGPRSTIQLPAGKHFIAVRRRGHRSWSREIEVKRGEKLELDADLETTTQRKLSWYVLGASGVAFAAAGIFGTQALIANGDASDLDDKRQSEGLTPAELAEYDRLRDRRDDKVQNTWVAAGVGAGIAVTGVLMLMFDNPGAEAPPMTGTGSGVSVSPLVAPDRAGLVVAGRF